MHASVASVSSLRPELLENSVAPIPTMAVASWCAQGSEGKVHRRLREHFVGVLAEVGCAGEARHREPGEPVGEPGVADAADVLVLDVDEEAAGQQVLVDEHV